MYLPILYKFTTLWYFHKNLYEMCGIRRESFGYILSHTSAHTNTHRERERERESIESKIKRIWRLILWWIFYSNIKHYMANMCIYQSLLSSDFHFCSFERIVVSMPVVPINSISKRRMMSPEVQTVQIGQVTLPVPPTTFKSLGTFVFIVVVSSVKGVATVIAKGIT
jgi:hypothetical protein